MRAIWATPKEKGEKLPDFPLSQSNREDIANLSSDFGNSAFSKANYTPQRIKVNRFMLSSLGAWADLRADFPGAPDAYKLVQWRQRGTMARDHHVKVVEKGFLFPLGHEASLVRVTERKFQRIPKGKASGQVGAFLRTRMFLVIKQPLRDYKLPDGKNFDKRFPFTTIRIKSLITPDLDPVSAATKIEYEVPGTAGFAFSLPPDAAFWPQVAGKDFLFALTGTDPRRTRGRLQRAADLHRQLGEQPEQHRQHPAGSLRVECSAGPRDPRARRPAPCVYAELARQGRRLVV